MNAPCTRHPKYIRSGMYYDKDSVALSAFQILLPLFLLFFNHGAVANASEPVPISPPLQATSVGYIINTFSAHFTTTNIDFEHTTKPGFSWYLWNFFNHKANANRINISDKGFLELYGDTTGPNGQIATAAATSNNSHGFVGTTFGGGGYFEAEIAFDPQEVIKKKHGCPAFWAMAVEHMANKGADQWYGQAKGYMLFAEVDILEYQTTRTALNNYTTTMHIWYGVDGTTCKGLDAFCRQSRDVKDAFPLVPENTNFLNFHRYGFLWFPATPTTLGYGQYFFDGNPIGEKIYWSMMPDDAQPPPVKQPWIYSILDKQHLVLILGTGVNQNMNVRSVNVWQKDNSCNLIMR